MLAFVITSMLWVILLAACFTDSGAEARTISTCSFSLTFPPPCTSGNPTGVGYPTIAESFKGFLTYNNEIAPLPTPYVVTGSDAYTDPHSLLSINGLRVVYTSTPSHPCSYSETSAFTIKGLIPVAPPLIPIAPDATQFGPVDQFGNKLVLPHAYLDPNDFTCVVPYCPLMPVWVSYDNYIYPDTVTDHLDFTGVFICLTTGPEYVWSAGSVWPGFGDFCPGGYLYTFSGSGNPTGANDLGEGIPIVPSGFQNGNLPPNGIYYDGQNPPAIGMNGNLQLLSCSSYSIQCFATGSIEASFLSIPIPTGHFIYFSSSFTPPDVGETTTFLVTGQTITFGGTYIAVPDSKIRVHPPTSHVIPTVTFDSLTNQWIVVTRSGLNGNTFFGAVPHAVSAVLNEFDPVTWSIGALSVIEPTSNAQVPISLSWKWAASVYSQFSSAANLGVKAVDDPAVGPFFDSKAAGTPHTGEWQNFVVAGGTGHGGTDFVGSYSAASTLNCVA